MSSGLTQVLIEKINLNQVIEQSVIPRTYFQEMGQNL